MMTAHTNGKHRFQQAAEAQRPLVARPSPDAAPRWSEVVEHWVGEHPVACVAAAVLAGATLGWLIKRR
jgi:ElaB/YqjD/DUF883 family membrane-anchored ribosome-binding protein